LGKGKKRRGEEKTFFLFDSSTDLERGKKKREKAGPRVGLHRKKKKGGGGVRGWGRGGVGERGGFLSFFFFWFMCPREGD